MGFTHLHLHTQYSLLDGAIKVKDLVERTKELGMDAVAVTDHGTMFGAVDVFQRCRAAGIKPIIGCEVYVAPDRHDRESRESYHLILLARNLTGYRNLVQLVSRANLEGFYYNPRIDKELLGEMSEGLIALTACLGGEVAQAILNGGKPRARKVIQSYVEVLEPGMFFLELQDNGLEEQDRVNKVLIELAEELDLPLVATNDCHYLRREDATAHDALMCIQTGKLVDDEDRIRHETDAFYFKSPQEMEAAFAHVPEALANTERIAAMCDLEIPLGQTFLPQYEVPEGHTLESFLREIAHKGLDDRLAHKATKGEPYDEPTYRARLDLELDVIVQMGFPGYFLIVWDFIAEAKRRGIPVGPGRGSGAGSLVAFSLGITDLDPIPYDLLFERFLNPERVSMPDFDIDFCMNRREEVIRYVTEKYGEDRVGQIVTFGSLKARGVVRDVARVLGMSYGDADRIAKLVPEGPGVTLSDALKQEPKLKARYEEEEQIKRLIDIALALEGLHRHTGVHAAGIVIGEKPLWEYVPVLRGQNGELVTQYAKDPVEQAGLVKFDFLGLRTLTVIHEAVRLVRMAADPSFDIDAIPMNDTKVFELLSSGNTTGVFQLESSGIKSLIARLRPDRFEDIIAAVALYRPGPLEGGMVDDFVHRKHGETRVEYLLPQLEEVLRETYGVIVYQEQVMKIANILAGYSLGQADILRRAMGKKKVEEMAREKKRFLEGAKSRGVDPDKAGEIFDLVEKFAGYGFNKSHSAAYALLCYQTAYLKAYYPVEFMAALLTSEKDNTSKVVRNIGEARAMGIDIKPPDVNLSEEDFTVVEGSIRFGLGAVKGVGSGAVQVVLEARGEGGAFTGLVDFCERVDSRRVNRKVIESLIKCGAFDFTGEPRDLLFLSLDRAIDRGNQAQRDRDSGQMNMLEMMGGGVQEQASGACLVSEDDVPSDERWTERERLRHEKQSLGFYITGHPLDGYEHELSRYANATTASVENLSINTEVTLAGVVAAVHERTLKNGTGRMANLTIEDRDGQTEVVCFQKLYAEAEEVVKSDEPLLVRGNVSFEGEGEARVCRIKATEVELLSDVRRSRARGLEVDVASSLLEKNGVVARLRAVLRRHRGGCPVRLVLRVADAGTAVVDLAENWCVEPSDALMADVERVVGHDHVRFR